MTHPHTLNWLAATLIALVLASAHLLDGPSDIEAAQDVATDVLAAQAQAKAHTTLAQLEPKP